MKLSARLANHTRRTLVTKRVPRLPWNLMGEGGRGKGETEAEKFGTARKTESAVEG